MRKRCFRVPSGEPRTDATDATTHAMNASSSSSDDAVVTMLGSLGLQVASRFARSLRESGRSGGTRHPRKCASECGRPRA